MNDYGEHFNDGLRVCDIFKKVEENTDNDEEMCSVINPDDFLNESFFLEGNVRIKTESESSGSVSHSPQQLTPPISPHPPYLSIILPIQSVKTSNCTVVKKVKPILPAAKNSGSSDSDTSNVPPVVDKNLIKQARIIRNRESALKSRHRKKEYLHSLEVEVCDLRKEVKKLREENSMLKQKLVSFTYQRASSAISKISTKNASFMLAMLLMIGFNLIPLGNYLTSSQLHRVERPSTSITSRHLLFVNESDSSENATNEASGDNNYIPLKYLNQTDRVRKANIENVMNWIPQPSELFNVSKKVHFESNLKKFEDPLQYKLSQLYEKSREKSLNPKKQFKKRPQVKAPPADENLYNPELFKFQEFFDEIQRKEDTFYVLSRSFDHLLLPAELESVSQIPIKMNLIMPRNDTLTPHKNKIMMMQIETIVLNTSIIEVKSIPSELVKGSSNSTTECNHQKNITRSENLPKARKLVPYFRFDLNSRK